MSKAIEKYLLDRIEKLEDQTKHLESAVMLLEMQRDEHLADFEEAEESLKGLLKLLEPSIYEAPDNGEKLRHISMAVWEKYSPDIFNFVEALLKEYNMIKVEEWEEINA